jgi:hypothetical protein
MPLQIGTWTMNVGGSTAQLHITSVDPSGNVVATINANASFAFWDEDSQKLMFMSFGQLFVGYLFTDTVNVTGVRGTVFFTLVGSAESFLANPNQIGQPTAKRSTLGWYAQIGVD